MHISEVRVKLVSNKDERLKAFCSVTFDDEFAVHDIKVFEGRVGYFVAMPSRRIADHCDKCDGKNHLRAKYCSNCGAHLAEDRGKKDLAGRTKLYADVAHPIDQKCRRKIQDRVTSEFLKELDRSKKPGYKPVLMDAPDDDEEVPQIIR